MPGDDRLEPGDLARAGAGERVTRLGVAGWPVGHSLSPVMQNSALSAVGLGGGWHYQLLPIPPELFAETVLNLHASGFRGLNVTIPHKAAALRVATAASERALAIGAANTLLLGDDGSVFADNTDGLALASALASVLPGGVRGRSAAVIGAGGSARAAVWALLDGGASSVRVWNRTAERALTLCAEVGGEPLPGGGVAGAREALAGVEVIVNCTAVGLRDGDGLEALPLDDTVLGGAKAIADYVYRREGTPLTAAARRLDVSCVDGLELLTLQGAEAFRVFTGLPAPVEIMRAAVRG